MDTVVGIALGLFWLISAAAKWKERDAFYSDVLRISKTIQFYKILAGWVLGLELLAAVLLFAGFAPYAGWFSLGLVSILTASFVLRSVRTASLECACLGRLSESTLSVRVKGLLPIASSEQSSAARIFARNGLIAVASAWIGQFGAVGAAGAAAVVFVLIAGSAGHLVLRARNKRVNRRWDSSDLVRRRRLFASDWYSGVCVSWYSCYQTRETSTQ